MFVGIGEVEETSGMSQVSAPNRRRVAIMVVSGSYSRSEL